MTLWNSVPKLSAPGSQVGKRLRPGYASLPLVLPLTNAAHVRNGSSMTALPVPGHTARRLHLHEQQAGGLLKRTRCRGGFRGSYPPAAEMGLASRTGGFAKACVNPCTPQCFHNGQRRTLLLNRREDSSGLRTNVADETGGGETRGVNLRDHLQSRDDHFNSLLTLRTGRQAECFL